jgi:Spy/CpxP family protein refolding chaperone
MTERGKTLLKMWLVVVGVFVLGCVTGVSLDSVYRLQGGNEGQGMRSGRDKDKLFERMKSDLGLNEQQAAQVRVILDQTREEYRQLRSEVRPRYDAVRQNARTKIRALLSPEQQQKFDAQMAERDARRNGDDKKER